MIQHDLRVGERGRKRDAALLEELFRLACRYAGQAPSLETFAREAQRALTANVGTQRVRQYLDFLDRTLLLRPVRPREIRLKRTRGFPKLCLADHGLRASWLQEIVPLTPEGLSRDPQLSDLAGRLAESIVGAYLLTISGLDLSHFAERPGEPEVDFIMTIGSRRIPVEVKYRRHIDPLMDTEGLRSFIEKTAYNAPFGILITQRQAGALQDPRIIELEVRTGEGAAIPGLEQVRLDALGAGRNALRLPDAITCRRPAATSSSSRRTSPAGPTSSAKVTRPLGATIELDYARAGKPLRAATQPVRPLACRHLRRRSRRLALIQPGRRLSARDLYLRRRLRRSPRARVLRPRPGRPRRYGSVIATRDPSRRDDRMLRAWSRQPGIATLRGKMSHRDDYQVHGRGKHERVTGAESPSASVGKRTLTMDLATDTVDAPEQAGSERASSATRRMDMGVRSVIQMKGGAPGHDVHKLAAEGISGSSTSLPFRDQIQLLFGAHDVGGIQSHIAGPATPACQGMGAEAYATGNHIAFRQAPDLHTAAHEAAHVVQQRAGVQLKGGVGEAGDEHERNADQVADAVVAGKSAEALLGIASGSAHAEPSGGSRRAITTQAASAPRLGDSGAVQQKLGKEDLGHSPCSQCGGDDCQCSDPAKPSGSAEAETKPAAASSPSAESKLPIETDLPLEVVRYIAQLGIRSPEALTKEQTQQIGRLAKSRMSHDKVIATGRRSGVNLPTEESPEQAPRSPGHPVQRQVGPGEAAAATASTMWWLTMVDGPVLPFGDIAYGIAIAAAAITAAVTASSAIEKICSDRLTGCLENPWQPPKNQETFGPRKDCGACYRECKLQVGIWPDYKCPR